MIFGNIEEASSVQNGSVTGKLRAALDYIRQCDIAAMNQGRNEIQGDDMYVMRFDGVTKPASELKAELHFEYADIHYVVEGEERIGFAPSGDGLEAAEDLREHDALLYEEVPGETMLLLKPGDFLVLFPGEVHRPWICADTPAPIRKLVVKIRF